MSSTEITPATAALPTTGDTKLVNVLPYAYWPMNERVQYAKMLAGAKELLPTGLRSPTPDETAAKVFLVMETGAMLGLHPMAAFQGIDVIEGSATISPQLFTALVRGAGHKLRIEESGSIPAGDFRVDVTLIRSDDPDFPIKVSWDLNDSVQAGLVELVGQPGAYAVRARSKNDNPLNHEKFPKDMTMWRALGRLARRGAADVTMGIGYFPEELEVAVNADGVRTLTDMKPIEDALIAELQAFDDKADMATLWLAHHANEAKDPDTAWTDRVEAEFTAHLSTLTKDSRPPKSGAPGQTGDADVDGQQREIDAPVNDLAGAQPSDYDDAELVGGRVVSKTLDDARAAVASVPAEPAPAETIDEIRERETREEEERSAREHAEYLAARERETASAPVAKPTAAAPLDMSALDGTTEP